MTASIKEKIDRLKHEDLDEDDLMEESPIIETWDNSIAKSESSRTEVTPESDNDSTLVDTDNRRRKILLELRFKRKIVY